MKKFLSMFLVLSIMLTLLPLAVLADSEIIATNRIKSDDGTINVEGVLTADGTLTVSGTGDMNLVVNLVPNEFLDLVIKVEITDGISSIGPSAFMRCDNLTTVVIPDSVNSIGESAFANCSKLTEISIPDGVGSIGNYAFQNCSSIKSISIPDNVSSVGVGAFELCSSLSSIRLPESLTEISDSTFYGCSILKSITVPNGVTSIGSSAFNLCTGLENITLPDSLTSIGPCAFCDCDSLTSVTLPDSVTDMGYAVFRNCNNLQEVHLSNSLSSIPLQAFSLCGNLGAIDIPGSVTTICNTAFEYCYSLSSVKLSEGLTTIEGYAFEGCKPGDVTLPNSVVNIYPCAFFNCQGLTSINIPDGIETIGAYTFYGCRELTEISLPDSVKTIEEGAFEGCAGLKELVMPDSISTIGISAFERCPNLGKMTFTGETAPSIDATAFNWMNAVAYYPVSNDSWNSTIDDGYGGTIEWVLGTYENHIHQPAPESTGVVAPTCTEGGYSAFICKYCGYSWIDEYTEPTGHNWDEGKVTKNPTEETEGEKTFTCSACGDSKTETIAKLDHTHKYSDKVTAPTCTEDGYTTHTCLCGDSYKDSTVKAAGHKWDEGKVTKDPTEKTEGEKTFTCSACGDSKTETVAKLDHTHKYSDKVTAPTCTEDGYTTHTCLCGDSYKDSAVKAAGHKWDEGKVTKEPAEETEGEKVFTCIVCVTIRYEKIAALNHTHTYTSEVTAPTCTEKGYTTYSCACGDKYTADYVKAVGHKFEWKDIGDGKHRGTCSCGAIETNDHRYDGGWVIIMPTVENTGEKVLVCGFCHDEKHLPMDRLEPVEKIVNEELGTKLEVPQQSSATVDKDTILVVEAVEKEVKAAIKEDAAENIASIGGDEVTLIEAYDISMVLEEVEVQPGGEVVVTLPKLPNISILTNVTVVFIDDENNIFPCETMVNDDGTITFVTDHFSSYGIIAERLVNFIDISENAYYFDPVMWAVDKDITSGLSADTFGPDTGCTRAQVVTFLWRAAGEPAPKSSENPFNDIKEGVYYYDAVLWAVENGITAGLSADTFGPDANCNRGQIVTFLWRASGTPAPTSDANPFEDVDRAMYYYDAVLWAVENGITAGLSADSFGPDATCTRGQVVTFLYRAYI